MVDLLFNHLWLLPIIGVISAFVFVISLLSLPWLVAKIPEDYFLSEQRRQAAWKIRHPAAQLVMLISKNLLGCILLLGGFLMLFLPGQGILTMVAGLLLIDYPGKFALERKIVNTPTVFKGLNWLRALANKPPFFKID